MTFKPEIRREVNGEVLTERAGVITFRDGYYETEDAKEIAYIKKSSEFGVTIHIIEEQAEDRKPEASKEEVAIIESAKRGRPKKVVDD